MSEALAPLVPGHDAILMANHGVVSYGADLTDAYMKMETVEHFAKIALVTHMLGRQNPLGEKEVERLVEAREKYRSNGAAKKAAATAEMPEANRNAE